MAIRRGDCERLISQQEGLLLDKQYAKFYNDGTESSLNFENHGDQHADNRSLRTTSNRPFAVFHWRDTDRKGIAA